MKINIIILILIIITVPKLLIYMKVSGDIEITKNELQNEKNQRQENSIQILKLQEKVYEKDISNARDLIKRRFKVGNLIFMGLSGDDNNIILYDYSGLLTERYIVNVKTDIIY